MLMALSTAMRRDQARALCSQAVASAFFAGAVDALGVSGVMVAFSAPGFEESAVKTAWVGTGPDEGAEASMPLAARLNFGR